MNGKTEHQKMVAKHKYDIMSKINIFKINECQLPRQKGLTMKRLQHDELNIKSQIIGKMVEIPN